MTISHAPVEDVFRYPVFGISWERQGANPRGAVSCRRFLLRFFPVLIVLLS